jgi:hypothetical protein
VRHLASKKYWHYYAQLPVDIQQLANRSFEVLKRDERHPSLHLKKVGRFWSVRVAFIIVPLQWRAAKIWSGFGLGVKTNMIS